MIAKVGIFIAIVAARVDVVANMAHRDVMAIPAAESTARHPQRRQNDEEEEEEEKQGRKAERIKRRRHVRRRLSRAETD